LCPERHTFRLNSWIPRKEPSMDLFSLTGRVALVTGGSRGLGRAMALALGKAGADLAICSRQAAEVGAAGRDLEAETGRGVLAMAADVTQAAGREAVYEAAMERFGRIDILV